MALLDERTHEAEEEGQQQRADMAAVDIGIRHDDDLAVPELFEIKLVADACAERGDDAA